MPSRKVRVGALVFVRAAFLPLREVAGGVLDVEVTGLLSLREVAAVLLLDRLPLLLLALREGAVVMLMVVLVIVRVVVLVVGHAESPIVREGHCQPTVKRRGASVSERRRAA